MRTLWIVGLVVATAVYYGFTASRTTLWDRDEPRNAYAAVEMDRTGNWLYPTIKGEVRAHKPILAYWMMIPSMRAFGQTEFAVRLPAIVGTLLAMVFTFLIGRRLASPKVALLAAALLPACPLVIATGATATTDGLLLGGIAMTFAALLRVVSGQWSVVSGKWPVPVWGLLLFGLTFAQYAKGPVGLAIPALAIVGYTIWTRKDRAVSAGRLGMMAAVAAVSIGLFLLWVVPANTATGGAFLSEGLGKHVVERSLKPMESHGGTSLIFALFYPFTLLLTFFPFTLYLPVALATLCGGRLFPSVPSDAGKGLPPAEGSLPQVRRPALQCARFLGAWMIATVGLMTCVATKLPHYVLPCFPALCLVCAAVPFATLNDTIDRRALIVGRWIFIVPCMLMAVVLTLAPWSLPFLPFPEPLVIPLYARLAATTMGIALGGSGLVAATLQKRGKHLATMLTAAAMILFTYLAFCLAVAPAAEAFKLSRPVSRIVRDAVPPDLTVGLCGYAEPSLFFYLPPETPVTGVDGAPERLRAFLEQPERPGLIIREREFQRLRDTFGDLPLHVYGRVPGFNYSKGKKTDIYFVRLEE
ncbi:MAG: glycosyltransferase family 39 protein [Kiritimatiellaeota bacterium]|nr:glycosyltransferase family 39 protein [Kiritimatiellota bacterium]